MPKIFAIADLHLAGGQEKPMCVFGEHWHLHDERIFATWKEKIGEKDLILIPGDISWAMRFDDAKDDLKALSSLPGMKVFVRGNHDYWWQKITLLNTLDPKMFFIQNNAFKFDKFIICGSRGWNIPGSANFTSEDEKIYARELLRMRMSLEAGVKLQREKEDIIVMVHFPPAQENIPESGFIDLFQEFGVKAVVYGHLHDEFSQKLAIEGLRNGIEYHLVSADYIDFSPKEILTY